MYRHTFSAGFIYSKGGQYTARQKKPFFSHRPTLFQKWKICDVLKTMILLLHNHILQSHPNTMRAYRRLSLAALACPLAGERAVILTLLPNTHSVISVYFPNRWSRASKYICKAETLVFTDCEYFIHQCCKCSDCDYCDL